VLKKVDTLEADYDLLFFSDHCVSDALRIDLIAEPRPKVALMDASYDTYEETQSVTPLVMPLYCTKLQEVLETVLTGGREPAPNRYVEPVRFNAHVLVAEDNEANQELISTLLGNMGVTFELVDNGADALERMRTGTYDVVLMDEQMPVMNGRDAVEAMREIEATESRVHLPVIALTANVHSGIGQRRIYDDFLGKPIRMDALVASLSRFVPSAEPRGPVAGTAPDHHKLCEILQVTEDQLRMLLGVYRDKMAQTFEKLSIAIGEQDLKQVALLAHSVKGSSSNFRFERMTQLAEHMEKEARSGHDAVHYGRLLDEMQACFKSLLPPGS
jgi:CheY-like chemotaxis protein/HPt (histidine-containing phosphotransfer) domain-containing protein